MLAIVDPGMGNLSSVARACEHVGLEAAITADPVVVERAEAVILPGVGAYRDAVANLREHGLVEALQAFVRSGRPLLGVCLGLQLLFEGSEEGGAHQGLGIFAGTVRRLEHVPEERCKVPNVGWRPVEPGAQGWEPTLLAGVPVGQRFYFVHSYVAVPADPGVVLCTSRHAGTTFCSGVVRDNVTAFQFHPERSGPAGLLIYQNLARRLR